ncbi:uncharacterized protein LOC142979539 [Anticarsia gemmatalis]|uniref:uncharacterized protein LOC142979539 n=1 Tax=Anticarsia gemmatalis TaxID=129554 RepID=UPI003F77728A
MQVLGVELHHITPEMHHSNGQVERYIRTVLNMLRIATNHRKSEWADELWQLQLILNLTKQKTTQTSALNLLVGHESATPAIRTLVRDVAMNPPVNRESRLEKRGQRTAERLAGNQLQQDAIVNEGRSPPRVFHENDLVFVIKYAQSQGKLDSGMRVPYRLMKALRNHRYELKLLAGAYGKKTYAAAQFTVPWKGEWTPKTCGAFFDGACVTLFMCLMVLRPWRYLVKAFREKSLGGYNLFSPQRESFLLVKESSGGYNLFSPRWKAFRYRPYRRVSELSVSAQVIFSLFDFACFVRVFNL